MARGTNGTAISLGLRVHYWEAVVVGVSGPPSAPVIVHRDKITLLDDASIREPYHAAAAVPLADAPEMIRSVEELAEDAAAAAFGAFVSSLGPIAAIGVVGGNRELPAELPQRLASHALLHACERVLFEQAVIRGATRAGLPVTTLPATKMLFADASDALGFALEPSLAALGKSVGKPWGKEQKEATAAALVALNAIA